MSTSSEASAYCIFDGKHRRLPVEGKAVQFDGVSIADWRTASAEYRAAYHAAKPGLKVKRKRLVDEDVAKAVKEGVPETSARERATRLYHHAQLTGDFPITVEDGTLLVTVADAMADPDRYDGASCCDPLEPTYRNDRRIGTIHLKDGKPHIWSWAHGGVWYGLLRRPAGYDPESQLEGLVERAQADPSIVLQEDIVEGLAKLKYRDPSGFDKLRRQLKDVKCSLKEMDKLVAAAMGRPDAREEFNSLENDDDEDEAETEDVAQGGRLPRGFRYASDGSIQYTTGKDEETGKKQWSDLCSPLEILARTRDDGEKQWGLLIKIKTPDGTWHNQAITKAQLVTNNEEIFASLADAGLCFVPSAVVKSNLRKLLTTATPSARVRTVSRIGWHGDSFVLPDQCFGANEHEIVAFQPSSKVAHNYHQRGSLKGWQNGVAAKAIGNSRLVLAISAAFAGPLLLPLGGEGGGVHDRGDSSIGKNTALFAAGSVWGGGDTENGFARSWRVTDNALESVCAAHCDTLLTLDELSQVDAKAASHAAYMIAGGQGKGRAGREGNARQVAEWRVVFQSTGEISLATKVAEENGRKTTAGQEVRVVDVEADAGAGMGLFENLHGYDNPRQFADAIKAASKEQYGHAARAFLTRLTEGLKGDKAYLQRERDDMAAFVRQHCPNGADGQVLRVASRFGLIAVAGELAAEYDIVPWDEGEATAAAGRIFGEWLQARGGTGPLEAKNALSQIRSIIERDGASRFQEEEYLGASTVDYRIKTAHRLGFIRRDTDTKEETYLVLPEAFRNELCRGHDHIAVARRLCELGIMSPGEGRNFAKKFKIKGSGQYRCYAINGQKLLVPTSSDSGSDI